MVRPKGANKPERALSGSDLELATRVAAIIDSFSSRKSAAEAAGVSEDVVYDYVKARALPPLPALVNWAKATGFSLDWLATGQGPMRLDYGLTAQQLPPSTAVSVAERDELPEGFLLLPRYNVHAASGTGAVVHSEQIVDFLAFKTEWVRRQLGIPPENLGLIENIGSSNEPTIRPGDLLLVNFGIDRVVSEHFYVIGREDELIIKRVQPMFNGDLVLSSDNPAYKDETVKAADAPALRVLGRVIWIGRMI